MLGLEIFYLVLLILSTLAILGVAVRVVTGLFKGQQ